MPFPSLPCPPALFPTYLVPSLAFRRRKSSVDSNASTSSTESASSSPGPDAAVDSFLSGHASHLRCARCLSDLAHSSQIISKGFTGRHGRAYLVAPAPSSLSLNALTSHTGTAKAKNDALPNLPNTYTHKPVPRQLVTGAHTVGDISCAHCGSVLGWKYVAAEEEAQRYKVGKFILETKRVCRASTWETEGPAAADHARELAARARRRRRGSLPLPPADMAALPEDEIEFDSQDEDECEDLFMGVWTPQLAAKRRKPRRFRPGDDV